MDSLKDIAIDKENYTLEARKHIRNILKKFKKKWHDCITGLKRIIRIRVFGKLKSNPKFVRVY